MDILQTIWSHSEGANVYLPMRHPDGGWDEGHAWNPETTTEYHRLSTGDSDRYFSPLRYNGKRRRTEVGAPGVLFADLDDNARLGGFAPPSLLVASSQDHQHAYWFLTEPEHDLDVWESKARGLSHALGADPGGWDSTQVLRIPNSMNYKYDPPQRVRVLTYNPYNKFRIQDFPDAPLPHRPGTMAPDTFVAPTTDELAHRADLLRPIWHNLDLETQSLLALNIRSIVKDRSAVIHKVGAILMENGCTPDQAFAIISPMPWNKFRDRPEALMNGLYKIYNGGPRE